MRKFRMYCVDTSQEGSEFELRFELNGKIIDKKTEYCFDDVLADSYDFFKRNCELHKIDTRFDELKVEILYSYNGITNNN